MAYSPIEQRYIDTIVEGYFPTMPVEPAAMEDEFSLEGVQLAAGPGTRTDAPPNIGRAKAPMTSDQAADLMRNMPLETQSQMIMRRIAEDQNAGISGAVIPKDRTMRQNMVSGMQQMLIDNTGMDNARARKLSETMFGGESSGIPFGIGLIDITPFVIPLATQEAGISGGEAMEAAASGEYGTAALKYGEGVLQSLDAVPGVALAAKGGKAVGEALAPIAGEMIEGYMRKTGGLMDIAPSGKPKTTEEPLILPSKFNPKTEFTKAIDSVSSNPDVNIYLPQAKRAPSVALRLAKVKIQGTGEKGTITVNDVGTVLEKSQLVLNKNKPLDPTKPKDLVKMVDSATAESQYQMSQPISGATWYEDDVHQAFMLGSKIIPELATDEPLRVITTAFSASTSYNKRAGENWPVALRITEHLMKTGKVASRNPDNGKLWGGTTGPIMEQQLKLHEYMIKAMGGMDNYAEWLLTPHTVKEITNMRAASGLYKTPSISGKANDMKMGAFIMGEKGGPFFLNLNGIKETTADKWFTRTYNRHAGTLTEGPVSEQGLVDAPRNESERNIMKQWNRAIASNIKLDEQANQAVLWYYEQSLYYTLGVKSARSESFSDGAKNLLNARGIPFTDAELAGARNLRNARQVTAEPTGTAGTGNTVGIGQTTPNNPTTNVTGGGKAPITGAE